MEKEVIITEKLNQIAELYQLTRKSYLKEKWYKILEEEYGRKIGKL